MVVGDAPQPAGHFLKELPGPLELTFIQYLPVKLPYSSLKLPDNVKYFKDLFFDNVEWSSDDYLYLTVKHLYVVPRDIGNRPGWHTDGFGSDDTNYILYSSLPTEFCVQPFDISEEHEQSMLDMESQAKSENIVTYPAGTILRLTNKVVHRTAEVTHGHYRAFVKVSVSKNIYNLRGNAHNYLFDYDWPMVDRLPVRNHTSPGV